MTSASPLSTESRRCAKAAKLRYVTDTTRGLRRKRSGRGFIFSTDKGERIRDRSTLERIRSLVIPPAWTDVWICPWAHGHLQAIGFDARGRKQYRYHSAWQQVRDEQKYGRLALFAEALPAIRRRVSRDLKRPGLPREKVLAAVVRLLELTQIRVGNDEYARENRTYGLTTIRNHHVRVRGQHVRFDFLGKHKIKHEIEIANSRLAQVVRNCQELPGKELFEYRNEDGRRVDVKSRDVNAYLRQITGRDFSAKDFRTWAGTVAAFVELSREERPSSPTAAKRAVARAVAVVAAQLGNTKAVCRKCYIHPAIIAAFEQGWLSRTATKHTAARHTAAKHTATKHTAGKRVSGLTSPEDAALAILRRHARQSKKVVAVQVAPAAA